jgi:ParB family chromosome partitioning protein
VTKEIQRLGKGLEALIPRSILTAGKTIISLPVQAIRANPYQPRKTFSPEGMRTLVESIRQHGLNQPILVRRIGTHYELIAGERRFRACQEVGMELIPAIIKNVSDQESLQLALIENLERQDLNPIEVARGYQRLVTEFGYTHQTIADVFGRSRSAVSNTVRLLNLPDDIQRAVESGDISEGHARTLLALGTVEEMMEYLDRIKSGGLNVRQIEHAVSQKKDVGVAHGTQLALFEELESDLRSKFATKVHIQGKQNKGKITFYYTSASEFETLISKLS